MKNAVVLRELQIERKASFEAVLPINFEAQELDVELLGLCLIEDPEDGSGTREAHVPQRTSEWTIASRKMDLAVRDRLSRCRGFAAAAARSMMFETGWMVPPRSTFGPSRANILSAQFRSRHGPEIC